MMVAEGKESFPFTVGEYVVFDRIGKGGMAEVFLARRIGNYGGVKRVVLKKIHSYLAQIPSFMRSLVNEAKIMDRVKSPFVTEVIDVLVEAKSACIIMEYVEGVDLNRLLGMFSKKAIMVPEEFVFHVISCILQGLHAVHETKDENGKVLNLVHLDLSPGNILVSFAGEVKICDFGVAATSDITEVLASRGEIRGKLSYMSPEQAGGERLDRRSDVFSAGIILWELLSGRKLYSSPNKNQVHRMALEARMEPLPPGRFQNQNLLERILGRALSKDRGKRYSTAKQFYDDIMDYVVKRGLIINQISIGKMLEEYFSQEIIEVRYERERVFASIAPIEG